MNTILKILGFILGILGKKSKDQKTYDKEVVKSQDKSNYPTEAHDSVEDQWKKLENRLH